MGNALAVELPVSPTPAIREVEVSPELAREWLEANTQNRPIRSETVTGYARDMECGDWLFTGDPIRRASDGTILDGQHRLMAIVRSGVSLQMVVVDGVPKSSQVVMDTGLRRTFAQALMLGGEVHTKSISSIVRLLIAWDKGLPMRSNTSVITHSEMATFMDEHPAVKLSVQLGDYTRGRLPAIFASVAGTAHFRCNRIDRDAASTFFHKLANGTNLQDGDPILTLRNRLLRSQAEIARLRTGEQLWLVVRAWNAYRCGQQLSKLQMPRPVTNANFPSLV